MCVFGIPVCHFTPNVAVQEKSVKGNDRGRLEGFLDEPLGSLEASCLWSARLHECLGS